MNFVFTHGSRHMMNIYTPVHLATIPFRVVYMITHIILHHIF